MLKKYSSVSKRCLDQAEMPRDFLFRKFFFCPTSSFHFLRTQKSMEMPHLWEAPGQYFAFSCYKNENNCESREKSAAAPVYSCHKRSHQALFIVAVFGKLFSYRTQPIHFCSCITTQAHKAVGQQQFSIQHMDRLAMGSTGACPSEKQQLESIKIWPGQARPLASPALSHFAWFVLCLAQASWYCQQVSPYGTETSVLPPQEQIALPRSSLGGTFSSGRGNGRAECTCCACRMCNPICDGQQRCSVDQSRQ